MSPDPEIRIYKAQCREDALAAREGRKPRLIASVADIAPVADIATPISDAPESLSRVSRKPESEVRMKVVVCMVGKAPGEGRYNWFKVFGVRGNDIQSAHERAMAWAREKASPGHDSIWTETAEVES